ncbi:MAG: hypothetical protein PHU85_12545 [Phycisphaerae bacterium]|nr:hypothetical protein [Phycisphaerae bacterium]
MDVSRRGFFGQFAGGNPARWIGRLFSGALDDVLDLAEMSPPSADQAGRSLSSSWDHEESPLLRLVRSAGVSGESSNNSAVNPATPDETDRPSPSEPSSR